MYGIVEEGRAPGHLKMKMEKKYVSMRCRLGLVTNRGWNHSYCKDDYSGCKFGRRERGEREEDEKKEKEDRVD